MYFQQQLKLSPIIFIHLLLMEMGCAPSNRTWSKLTRVYSFGTKYNKDNFTHQVTPLFSTLFDAYDYPNASTATSKQESSSTVSSIPQFTSAMYSGGLNKKQVIDKHILFQIFNESNYNTIKNKTLKLEITSRIDNVDFTTAINLETTGTDNSTSYPDDYRFSGGIAAQHAAISLIGR